MKVYSISQWVFVAICILILILPVGRQWKLLTTGSKVQGTVTQMTAITRKILGKQTQYGHASKIEFVVEGQTYTALGPLNYEYDSGRRVMVYYDNHEPSQNCILTFSGFYLDNYTVLPIILLVLWAAFYMSFNNYQRRQRFRKHKAWQNAQQNNRDQAQRKARALESSSKRAMR
jgi:hypothetical protein